MNRPTVCSPLFPPAIAAMAQAQVWGGLHGCGDSLALAEAVKSDHRLYLVVTPDTQTMLRLEHELLFFLGDSLPVLQFPDWETLPYDVFSPLPEIISQRIKTLAQLPAIRRGVMVATAATLMQKLAPRTHILANSLSLALGGTLVMNATRIQLESVGYQCVSQVMQHGEFAIRGAILDLFPMGSALPYRIELFDEEIESIRTFDPETQRSKDKVDSINLFPAREFPFNEESVKQFRRRLMGRNRIAGYLFADTLGFDNHRNRFPRFGHPLQREPQHFVNPADADDLQILFDVLRDFRQVFFVFTGNQYRVYSPAPGGKQFFLQPAYRQDLPPQGNFSSHGDI